MSLLHLRSMRGGTPVGLPTAPSSLSATAVSDTQINLAWTDNSSNETGFVIERSADGSTGWSVIHTTAANATSYNNTGLTASTAYYYRVKATNASGDSSYTSVANDTTDASGGAFTLWSATEDVGKRGTGAGTIKFLGAQIKEISSATTVDFYFERVGDCATSVSGAWELVDYCNAAGLFGTQSGTIDYDIGEKGWQKITLTFTGVPSNGFAIARIELTGSYWDCPDGYVWISNPSTPVLVASASADVYYLSPLSSGANSTTYRTGQANAASAGAGSFADPFRCPTHAFSTILAADNSRPRVCYMRGNNGGVYCDNTRLSGMGFAGCTINGDFGIDAPLILLPYPEETVTINQQNLGTHDGAGFNQAATLLFNPGSGHVFTRDINHTNAKLGFYCEDSGTRREGIIQWGGSVSLIGSTNAESNISGTGFHATNAFLAQDVSYDGIYSQQGGGSSNAYDAVGAALTHGAQAYSSSRARFVHCTFDRVSNGVYIKVGNTTVDPCIDVSHCKLLRASQSLLELPTVGTEIRDVIVRHNVLDNPDYTAARTQYVLAVGNMGGVDAGSTGLHVYGNTGIQLQDGIENRAMVDAWFHDNDLQVQGRHIIVYDDASIAKIALCDYNNYRGSPAFRTHRFGAGDTNYDSLAAWRGAYPGDDQLDRDVDENATTVSDAYTGGDYTCAALETTGRLGRPCGVNGLPVGVQ